MDNIVIERLWRSIKYEEVHLKAHADEREDVDGGDDGGGRAVALSFALAG
jgi:hypothetical protein